MLNLAITVLVAAQAMVPPAPCCGHSDDWLESVPEPAKSAIVALREEPTDGMDPNHAADIQRDIELGDQYAEEIKKELEFSENQQAIDRVTSIGNALGEVARQRQVSVLWGDARLNPFPYRFHVLAGKDVNAFSIPGGNIYIYEGLVEFAETDHELAGVIAHEISHAAFRHVAELQRRRSQFDLVTIPLILAALLTRSSEASAAMYASMLASQAFTSGWSVEAETSADYGALQYMIGSQWDPAGLLTFMERLAFKEGPSGRADLGIYRTHPPTVERAQFIIRTLRERGVPIRRSMTTTTFRASAVPAEDGSVAVYFGEFLVFTFGGDAAPARAATAVERLNLFFDGTPLAFKIRRGDGIIYAGFEELFEILPEDLVDGQELDAAANSTVTVLKQAAYNYSFRTWDTSVPVSSLESAL